MQSVKQKHSSVVTAVVKLWSTEHFLGAQGELTSHMVLPPSSYCTVKDRQKTIEYLANFAFPRICRQLL